MKIHLFIACILSICLFYGCSTCKVPFTGRTQMNSVSSQRLNAKSAFVYNEIITSSLPAPEYAQSVRVHDVGTKLVKALEKYYIEVGKPEQLSEFSWDFNVIVNSIPNASCFPGGKIIVHSGMFDIATTDHQLAAILAHEMAHALAHHTAEKISNDKMMKALTNAMAASCRSSTSKDINRVYVDLWHLGCSLPHSRFQESEADHIGLVIMSMAGYDPNASVYVWSKMMQLHGNSNGFTFLNTHPSNKNRMIQMGALVPTVMPIFNAVTRNTNSQ